MDILLDTHIFLWWEQENPVLSGEIYNQIETATGEIFVSVASIWEIAIKRAKGRLDLSGPVEKAVLANGFSVLPITADHAELAGSLPPHHSDPFDRMLIAQALEEGLVLATVDHKFSAYNVPKLRDK